MKQTLKEHVEDHLRIIKKERKLPEITVSEWLEAERLSGITTFQPRPPNSKTSEEYAQEKGLAVKTARHFLYKMVRDGLLEARPWHDGTHVRKIYWPKPKK